MSDKYFRECSRQLRAEKTANDQPGTTSSGPAPPPPPPLLRAGQPQPQCQVQMQTASVNEVGAGDMLMELQDIPPMQQYNVEYVHGVEGTTYMKL